MGFLLCALALLLLMAAGCGTFFLVAPSNRRVSNIELFSAAILYGISFVTFSVFACGWLVKAGSLRLVVSVLCLIVYGAGAYRKKRVSIVVVNLYPPDIGSYLTILLLMIQFAFVAWASFHTPLGWDGLFNWEIKARIAFENGGSIPPEYFSSQSLWWSHRGYPLLLPLLEAWFYSWLGVAHQGVTKFVLLLFYVAALGFLAIGNGRTSRVQPLLLFFIPFTWFGDGGVISGYADFPLAAYYLASAIYFGEYWESGKSDVLGMFGIFSTSLLWIKQEGVVLWAILWALILIKAARPSEARMKTLSRIVIAVLPGVAVLICWAMLLRAFGVQTRHEYLPLTIQTLKANVSRLPSIFQSLQKEFVNWKNWSLLWLLLLPSLYLLRSGGIWSRAKAYFCAIVLPMPVYLCAYLFISTANASIEALLAASLSRNLLSLSLVALILIGEVINSAKHRHQKFNLQRFSAE